MFELFYNFNGFNKTIFLFCNYITNINILAQVLQILSYCFNIPNFAIVYSIYCLYYYVQLKKIQNTDLLRKNFWTIYHKMLEIGIIYTVFGVVFTILKFTVNLPRPFCSIPKDDFITIANIQAERCLSSFPSSHAGLAFLVSYFIWPYINAPVKIMMSLIIALVSISRMTLAMHYPADLIYGIIIAIFVILIGKNIYQILEGNIVKFIGNIISAKIFRLF